MTDFQDALGRARETKRLLLILPDDHPATDDGGMGFETMRVVALCDARVRRLINRRFVPYYTNMRPATAAHDADALAFIVKRKPVFGKTGATAP